MCKFDMEVEDPMDRTQRGFVLKPTRYATNSWEIARRLQGECSNTTGTRPWHRHMQVVGHNLGKIAQVYPPKLVSAVLQGLRAQLKLDGTLTNLEEKATGPVCEEPKSYIRRREW